MPASRLTHPLFGNGRLNDLQLPPFNPVRAFPRDASVYERLILLYQAELTKSNISKAMAFPMPEDDAMKIFGVPTNVFIDVCISHKVSAVERISIGLASRTFTTRVRYTRHHNQNS